MSGEGRAEETFTALLPFIPVGSRLVFNVFNHYQYAKAERNEYFPLAHTR